MNEFVATMTSRGQVTIPLEIRRTLGLKRGDKVVFQLEGRGVRLVPASSRLADGYRSIPALALPKTWQDIEGIVENEQAEAYSVADSDVIEKRQAGESV